MRRLKVSVALVDELISWWWLAELIVVSVILKSTLCCTNRWAEDLGIGRHVESRWLNRHLSWRLLWLCCSCRWLERRFEVLDIAHYRSEGIACRLHRKWITAGGLRCRCRFGCSRWSSWGDNCRLSWCLLGGNGHILEWHRSWLHWGKLVWLLLLLLLLNELCLWLLLRNESFQTTLHGMRLELVETSCIAVIIIVMMVLLWAVQIVRLLFHM